MSQFIKRYGYIILLSFLFIGLLFPVLGLVAILCMILPMLVSLIRGRYWCGNLCPRGNFFDHVLSREDKRSTPRFFSNIYFRIGVLVFLIANLALGIYLGDGSLKSIGLVFYRLILLTTIIGIYLGSIYNHRTWCRFCPMGTLSSVIAKFRSKSNQHHFLKIDQSCIGCKVCSNTCPMDIEPHTFKGNTVSHPDCINCKICVKSCPKQVIK